MFYIKTSKNNCEIDGFVNYKDISLHVFMLEPFKGINEKEFGKDITLVIYELYKKYGNTFPDRLNGAFSIVINDSNQIKLFVDYKGLETIYYFVSKDTIIIADELKKIKNKTKLEVNETILLQYFTYCNFYTKETMCKNIYKVLPHEPVIIDTNNMKVTRIISTYYSNVIKRNAINSEKKSIKIIELLLEENIKQNINYFQKYDYEIYNLLSGGVDSSLIQAYLSKNGYNNVATFGFKGDRSELDYANDIVKCFDLKQEIVEVKIEEYLSSLKEGIRITETPYMFSDIVMLNSILRNHNNVLFINGNGADAIFGHTRFLFMIYYAKKYVVLKPLIKLIIKLNRFNNYKDMYYASIKDSLSSEDLEIITYRDNLDIVKKAFEKSKLDFLFSDVINMCAYKNYSLSDQLLIHHSYSGECYFSNRLSYCLSKKNKNMIIFPYWEKEITELMLNIPLRLKLKNKTPKYLEKKILEKYLPKKFIYRKKLGMETQNIPFNYYFKNNDSFLLLINEIKEKKYKYFTFDYDSIFSKNELVGLGLAIINFHIWHKEFID